MFNRIRKRLRKLIKLLPQKSQFLHSFQHSDLVIPGKHPENESSDEMLRQPRKIYLDKNGNQGTIWAGRHTRVNQVSFYGGHANDVLVLGSFCTLGRGSRIFLARERGADRVTNFPVGDIFSGTQLAEMAFLTRIDNDVSIGEGAMILPGVHIHNGAVVEPGSVVTQDVAAYAVVAGCPAVFRSWRIENDQQRQEMEALAWWEWKDRLILGTGQAGTLVEQS
jgi:acetyltransferase-like isoleucine patch superfamily enzyme